MTFNQHNHDINVQLNADTITNSGSISAINNVQRSADLSALLTQLSQLQQAIAQAAAIGTLTPAQTTVVQAAVDTAARQAQLPAPDKKTLLDHLTTAKTFLETMTSGAALVPILATVIDTVHKALF